MQNASVHGVMTMFAAAPPARTRIVLERRKQENIDQGDRFGPDRVQSGSEHVYAIITILASKGKASAVTARQRKMRSPESRLGWA